MSIFDLSIDRHKTNSFKWDMMEKVYHLKDTSNILPMWVADMDFAAPEAVTTALKKRLEHPVFGYSFTTNECYQAVTNWLYRRHNWTVPTDTILFHHGVIPAIASIIETFTTPGDLVAISSPVYPPFTNVPKSQGREVIRIPLIEKNGSYIMDFENFEQALSTGVKLYILCNPHNPAGIVWSESDLREIVRLCAKYDVLILSDEIHSDLVFESEKHIPIAKIADEEENRIITCIAPTKTFNLAGIQAAAMIVPDKKKRLALEKNAMAHGQLQLNIFATQALQAAYEHGEAWLDELLQYVDSNINVVIKELNALDGITVSKPQGTYLIWIDYRKTGLTEKEMMNLLLQKGQLALEPGTKYGEEGQGFLRMNVACPRNTVEEGIKRFKLALE